MKKLSKMFSLKMLIAAFALVAAICVCGTEASAATQTKKLKLIKGEKFDISFIGGGTLNKVTSSNSKVVKAKKTSKSGSYYATISAKKKGTATVTCKFDRGTMTYKITVVKPDFSVTPRELSNSYLMATFKNKLGFAYLSSAKVVFKLKDSAGQSLTDATVFLYDIGPKKTAAGTTYVGSMTMSKVDWSKSKIAVYTERGNILGYSFKDYTKNVKFTAKKSGNAVDITSKCPSLSDGSYVESACDVYFYDSSNKLVDIKKYTGYLRPSRNSNTTTLSYPYGATSYKVKNKRAYMRTVK